MKEERLNPKRYDVKTLRAYTSITDQNRIIVYTMIAQLI